MLDPAITITICQRRIQVGDERERAKTMPPPLFSAYRIFPFKALDNTRMAMQNSICAEDTRVVVCKMLFSISGLNLGVHISLQCVSTCCNPLG